MGRMPSPARDTIFGFSTPIAKGAAVIILTVAVTVFLFSVPDNGEGWRGTRALVQKFYFLPLLLAAAWFGIRGAVAATAAVTAVMAGLIGANWPGQLEVQVERMGEVGVFWLVGALAANFFEQQKKHVNDLKTANENTLYVLASALDMREENTGRHSRRVADYAVRLAAEMGIKDPDALAVIWKGALLHDLGKIGIPDRILLKPGRLDHEEWDIMKQHTTIGSRILEGSTGGFIKLAEVIALTHHEKWDGSGYPQGLKGTKIPLVGRITTIADVFDALNSKRPYKDAFPVEESFRMIREGRGTHFDPDVVDAFFDIQDEILDIKERFKDDGTSLLVLMATKTL